MAALEVDAQVGERARLRRRPAKEAERLLVEHVSTVCGHFGDIVSSYDVVNEAVDPKTGELRANVFTERLGALEELDLMFRLAREYAPQAQLVYNDYMSWGDGYIKHRAGVLEAAARVPQARHAGAGAGPAKPHRRDRGRLREARAARATRPNGASSWTR